MFKRKPRSYSQRASDIVYPRGGWGRAIQYTLHRVRRLPDQPHRIGRGVAAGVFISFTPLFGIHLLGAMAVGWAIGGNVLAAVIGSLVGNPVTIPFIAVLSLRLGRWMLGVEGSMAPTAIFEAFSQATRQLTHNVLSIFDERVAHWDRLGHFWDTIFLPYLVGGFGPGLLTAIAFHYMTVPLVRRFQARRAEGLARRARLRAEADAALYARAAAEAREAAGREPDPDAPQPDAPQKPPR